MQMHAHSEDYLRTGTLFEDVAVAPDPRRFVYVGPLSGLREAWERHMQDQHTTAGAAA